MPYADINGQRLYYEDTGGDKPAIVFSHGLLMDGSMFAPQLEALQQQWRCITWDERGHGKTTNGQTAPFSYYDSANDLVALLDHLGIEQAVLAGMSQGGYLSLRCALRHPSRVRALVLLNTQALQEQEEKMHGHRQLIDAWMNNGLSDEHARIIEGIILGENWEGAAAWRTHWQAMQRADVMQSFVTLSERDDISDAIAAIRVPTLVVHGEQDQAIDLVRAEDMANRIAGAKLVVVPGAGHAANLTHPGPTNRAIEAFLARL